MPGLVRKNLAVLAHRCGFQFVCVKRAGTTRVRRQIVRHGSSPLAVGAVATLPTAGRFFSVAVDARPGINHLRHALELLIREALAMGRTPVAFKPRFDPRHNLGHDLDVDWDTYIDLHQVELVDRETGSVLAVRVWRQSEVPALKGLSALWVERNHLVTKDENKRFDLIVRHNQTGLAVPPVHDGPLGLPGHAVRFRPSRRVLEMSEQVRSLLGGSFIAVHVRRDDMLEMKEQYPNLDRDTRPDNIARVLKSLADSGSTVYILTNERDRQFFIPLKSRFRTFQYFDFPELAELVEGARPDNFLLFEIEKQLFERATHKVHTFSRPDGVERVALTQDKGWA